MATPHPTHQAESIIIGPDGEQAEVDSNGRLKVNATGVTLEADMIDLDTFGITGGVGGESGVGGKSLKDIDTQVAAVLAKIIAAPATQTTLAAVQTSVEVMDDWDESDRAKVNPIVGQAGVAAGTGVMGVTVPRVTLATDDPAVVATEATAVATQTTAHDTATQILTLGAATISKTLVSGGVYEIHSINCTTFAHTVDAVTDANKRIIRQIGNTQRFTATATTYYFWTEDGAALTAYLVRVA